MAVDGLNLTPHQFLQHDLVHSNSMTFQMPDKTIKYGPLARREIVEIRKSIREFAETRGRKDDKNLVEAITFIAIHEYESTFHVESILNFLRRKDTVEIVVRRMREDDLGQSFKKIPTHDEIASAIQALDNFLVQKYLKKSKIVSIHPTE